MNLVIPIIHTNPTIKKEKAGQSDVRIIDKFIRMKFEVSPVLISDLTPEKIPPLY
jgi:hypothetical protein